jgi:hypothetical protein
VALKSRAVLRTFNVQGQDGAMGLKSEMYAHKQEPLHKYDPSVLTMSERIAIKYSPSAYGLSARTIQLPLHERPQPPPELPDLSDILPDDLSQYEMPVRVTSLCVCLWLCLCL